MHAVAADNDTFELESYWEHYDDPPENPEILHKDKFPEGTLPTVVSLYPKGLEALLKTLSPTDLQVLYEPRDYIIFQRIIEQIPLRENGWYDFAYRLLDGKHYLTTQVSLLKRAFELYKQDPLPEFKNEQTFEADVLKHISGYRYRVFYIEKWQRDEPGKYIQPASLEEVMKFTAPRGIKPEKLILD